MCGISGIIGSNWDDRDLEKMVQIQNHRGPDFQATYINDNHYAALGHNRLSIIDLSENGRQPMFSADGSKVIVFNGEIYNYQELYGELKGYRFKSKTDTEVILAAYEKWGENCVQHFNGMFAFAIWNKNNNSLFCARDRIGIKPFYYSLHQGNFVFASEIKALLEYGCPAQANDTVIHSYLTSGQYESKSDTFFEGIKQLPGGSVLVVKNGSHYESKYWDLFEIVKGGDLEPPLSMSDWRESLEALLLESIKLRLRSDVPLGLHLSGGLDSSVLLTFLGNLLPERSTLKCFTGTYGSEMYDETIYSNQVSKSLKVKLKVSEFDKHRFWDIAEKTQWYQDQPFGGIATMVYLDMEKMAKHAGITVLLEGQGGDELFGGYKYYIPEYLKDIQANQAEKENFIKNYCTFHSLNQNPFRSWVNSQLTNGTNTNTYQDGSSFLKLDCINHKFLKRFNGCYKEENPSTSYFTNARYRDLTRTKLPRVLRFNDRMSMSASCELRVPILDHRIIEMSFRISNRDMLKNGSPKYPLRAATGEKRLISSIRNAPKRAVVTPQREWFRGFLRNDVRNRLLNTELEDRGYLNKKLMLSNFDRFCGDMSVDNSFFIWQWLNLDLWFKVFKIR